MTHEPGDVRNPGGRRFLPGLQGVRVLAMVIVAEQNLFAVGALSTRPLQALLTAQEALFIFVAISGFVLTWHQLGRPSSWREWYARRLFGLYSMYWFLFAVVLTMQYLGDIRYPTRHLLLSALGIQGLFPDTQHVPSGPWWYVAVLLQLYLAFPPVFKAVVRFPWIALGVAGGITVGVGPWLPEEWTRLLPVVHYLLPFVCGAALARVWSGNRSRLAGLTAGAGAAAVYVFLTAFWLGGWQRHPRALAAAAAAFLFFELVWLPRPLRWLGGITFAYFLTHQETLRWIHRLHLPEPWPLVVWLPASLLVAWLATRAVAAYSRPLSTAVLPRTSSLAKS